MVELDIRGINVEFPFKPYQCQLDYMDRVIESLQTGKNALLESPTGTGKTLCLLCATLAWQKTKIYQIREGSEEPAIKINYWKTKKGPQQEARKIPHIIYSSRTHSQLSQSMNALRNTAYKDSKAAVIASRDQLCINPSVLKIENQSTKLYSCKIKVKQRSCHFYNNLEKQKDNLLMDLKFNSLSDKIGDIENLVDIGKNKNCCPYFLSRTFQQEADITFMPYNYLLDPRVRRSHGINLDNCVIIFDEAHNIEQVCEDSASVDLTMSQLASSIEELKKLACYIYDHMNDNEQTNAEEGESDKDKLPDIEQVLLMKQSLIDFETKISELKIDSSNQMGLIEPPDFLLNILNECGITMEKSEIIITLLEDCVKTIGMSIDFKLTSIGMKGIDSIASFLSQIFVVDILDMGKENILSGLASCYRVNIRDKETNSGSNNNSSVKNPWVKRSVESIRVISFWCLTPGKSMSALMDKYQIRNVILTSGTLFPVATLKMDMKIPFEIELRNGHVISNKQLQVNICCKGPDDTPLNSSYETRDTLSYTSALGNTLINIARLVPKGLLIVFPSYSMMKKCIEKWEKCDIYNRILAEKQIILEPQDKTKFKLALQQYELTNTDSDPCKSACLLAVARGKVSEGLDLSDDRGRAVVIIGLPYPAMMEPRIKLKMKFLDERLQLNEYKASNFSGRSWYNQQAYRAINQALGRVIRHHQDYGMVYLCDERFASSSARAQLPSWVQPMIKISSTFSGVVKDTVAFFRGFRSTVYNDTSRNNSSSKSVVMTSKIQQRENRQNKVVKSIYSAAIDDASKVNSFCFSMAENSAMSHYDQLSSEPPSSVAQMSSNQSNLFDILASSSLDIDRNIARPIKRDHSQMNSSSTAERPTLDQTDSQNPIRKKPKYKLVKSTIAVDIKKYLNKFSADIYSNYKSIIILYREHNITIDQLAYRLKELFTSSDGLELLTELANHLFQTNEDKDQFISLLKSNQLNKSQSSAIPTNQNISSNNNNTKPMRCMKCLRDPAVVPMANKICKHICCFQCWYDIIESAANDDVANKKCPCCGKLVRRRQLVKLTTN